MIRVALSFSRANEVYQILLLLRLALRRYHLRGTDMKCCIRRRRVLKPSSLHTGEWRTRTESACMHQKSIWYHMNESVNHSLFDRMNEPMNHNS